MPFFSSHKHFWFCPERSDFLTSYFTLSMRSKNSQHFFNYFDGACVCVMNKVKAERTETNFQIEKYLQFT